MASVQDIVECPQCGSDALRELRTGDLSETFSCLRCGYGETTRPIVDRVKQKADSEHRAWFKTRKACPERSRRNGERIYRTVKHVGCGAYRLELKKGGAVVGSVNCRVTPKIIAMFKRDLGKPETPALHHTCPEAVPRGTQCGASVNPSRSYLTRWNSKRCCVEVVVGTLPRHIV